jgi:hypothetical protein
VSPVHLIRTHGRSPHVLRAALQATPQSVIWYPSTQLFTTIQSRLAKNASM